MINSFRLGACAALAIAGVCAVSAQTAVPSVTTLSLEGSLPFGQIGFVGTPDIPANVLQSIVGGALEIRQAVTLRSDGLLRVRHLLVPAGAPNPTPAGSQIAVVEDYTVRVNDVIAGSSPASITFIGQVDQERAVSPFGMSRGLPVFYSFGYQTGETTQFGNVSLVIPGRMATYMLTSTGTLVLANGGTTPPPDGGVTIGLAERISTVQPEIVLDAMATDAENRELTYSWRVVSGSGSVLNPNEAQTRVQLPRVAGESVFEVTVTPAGGTPVSRRVAVSYIGSPF